MTHRLILVSLLFVGLASMVVAQEEITITGTAVIYGSGLNTRTTTRGFTLNVKSRTSSTDAKRFLASLEEDGQDALLRAMDNQDLGRFSFNGRLGERLTGVVIDEIEGSTRIRAVFKRWIGFGEIRGGYRSTDYPFGYVEVVMDPRTGKGDGTIFPMAKIRFKTGKSGSAGTVEIEDFGTLPGRLIGVRLRGSLLP